MKKKFKKGDIVFYYNRMSVDYPNGDYGIVTSIEYDGFGVYAKWELDNWGEYFSRIKYITKVIDRKKVDEIKDKLLVDML